MKIPRRVISSDRKAFYYTGMALTGIGILLFLSTFVTFLANFGNFQDFEGRARSMGFRAVGGMALIMVGGLVMRIGLVGWAGSGLLLDPERARKDVEPWSRMGGGIVQDALSEVDVVNKLSDRLDSAASPSEPAPHVKVRCQKCQALNDESARFCNQCGSAI